MFLTGFMRCLQVIISVYCVLFKLIFIYQSDDREINTLMHSLRYGNRLALGCVIQATLLGS